MKPTYQTKEFWKQVQREYNDPAKKDCAGYICHRSDTFAKEWENHQKELQNLGIEWIVKSRIHKFETSELRPYSLLFYCKTDLEKSRPAFIRAMIKKFS